MDHANECTFPEVKKRAHYLCWLASALAAATLLGITFDLLIVSLAGGDVGPVLVPLVYLSVIVPPYVYVWRKYGETRCGFLDLEHALEQAASASPEMAIPTFEQVLGLIERIERARGMDRQLVRNEAKAWLAAHAGELSRDERAYVADHLGYLHKP